MRGFFSDFFILPQFEFPAKKFHEFNPTKPQPLLERLVWTCLDFLESLTRSHELLVQISYIRNMDNRTRRLLKDTILVRELFVAYSHVDSAAYRILRGKCDNGELKTLQFGCRFLASHLDS